MYPSAKLIFIIGFVGATSALVLFGLGGALVPLLIAFGLAYLNYPLIRAMEKRGLARHYAVSGVFALITVVLVILLILVIPGLVEDTKRFLNELPQTSAVAIDKVEQISTQFGFPIEISKQGLKEFLTEHASDISGDFLKSSSLFLGGIFSNFFSALLAILNLFLIPLFFFHLINRYESLLGSVYDLVPQPWRRQFSRYIQLANTVLTGYIRGQLLVALILAFLYAIGLSAIGLQFGILIGLATGLLSVIPYVGSILGFCAAMAIALANYSGFGSISLVILVFVIVQALEGIVITPKLVGDKVGLSALSTMLALIIGGNLFGVAGMIIAIPMAAILKNVLLDLKREYRSLKFFNG